MSAFVLSNLVVTAGMLTPGLGVRIELFSSSSPLHTTYHASPLPHLTTPPQQTTGTILWQITNQSLNVGINYSNANKSTPLSTSTLAQSYALAVSVSCGVAIGLNALVPRLSRFSLSTRQTMGRLIPFAAVASAGALNVFVMRGEEMRVGIDVFPSKQSQSQSQSQSSTSSTTTLPSDTASLGKSRTAATLAVTETAASRVFNSTPIMVLPPLILYRLQQQAWLKSKPRLVLPVNLGLILTTSVFALPLALAVFPQRQSIAVEKLEGEFVERVGRGAVVEFNRGI